MQMRHRVLLSHIATIGILACSITCLVLMVLAIRHPAQYNHATTYAAVHGSLSFVLGGCAVGYEWILWRDQRVQKALVEKS